MLDMGVEMRAQVEEWIAAGGDPRRLDFYGTIGTVRPFAAGGDRALASVHPSLPEVGAVGDWVGGDEVRLAAEDWLRAEGCRVVRGPMELCTWFPYRANLGPFDESPFLFEPTERPERWLAAGYEVAATYASAVADHDRQIQSALDRAAALAAQGWRVESLPRGSDGKVGEGAYREAVSLFHALSSEGFRDAYAYAPVPESALQAWYAPFRAAVDPRLTFVAFGPNGRPGGFLFALPDHADPERRWFLVKSLAVLPEYRENGLGTWLVAAAHTAARAAGYRAGVHCLMWTSSRSNQISRHGGRQFRRYALYEKRL